MSRLGNEEEPCTETGGSLLVFGGLCCACEAVFGAPVVECGVEFGSFGADGDIAIGDLYVEAAEEGREEVAPPVVGKLSVERGRVFQETDECVDRVDAVLDALHGMGRRVAFSERISGPCWESAMS